MQNVMVDKYDTIYTLCRFNKSMICVNYKMCTNCNTTNNIMKNFSLLTRSMNLPTTLRQALFHNPTEMFANVVPVVFVKSRAGPCLFL